jgi:hypothetical protein
LRKGAAKRFVRLFGQYSEKMGRLQK